MNSGATAERVYDALKQRLLHRRVRPGTRLDPAVLAEALISSVTPVRDALHMLTGEGLVETSLGDGFRVPQVDEPGLKDLYAWNHAVLTLAMRDWPRTSTESPDAIADGATDIAERTAALFLHIARRASNAEHGRAIAKINDRLHAARTVEELVLPDIAPELAPIAAACDEVDLPGLRRLLTAYHRRRARVAAEIVRRLYRTDEVEPGL